MASCALGAVTGVGFKLIAPKLSSQAVFEVGTKFAFSLCFIDLLCCVMLFMLLPGKLHQSRIFFQINFQRIIVNFCPVSFTLISAAIAVQGPLVGVYVYKFCPKFYQSLSVFGVYI